MRKQSMYLSATLIVVLALLFTIGKGAYGSFESVAQKNGLIPVAKWDIKIDNQSINNSGTLRLTDYSFINDSHTEDGYIAPGSIGTVNIEINPNGTNTAIKYTINYKDHVTNPDCVLTITNISFGTATLTKTGPTEYTGILTLDDINRQEKLNLTVDVEWRNDETQNELDTLVGMREKEAMFIDLTFNAKQYTGESITPYIEEGD